MIFLRLSLLLLISVAASCSSHTAPKERSLTIEAKPVFKKDGSYRTLEAGDRSIYWPPHAPRPDELERDRHYQFELVEEKIFPDHDIWSPELVRLRDGDDVLFDASICAVHKIPMKRTVVPITYGLIFLNTPYGDAQGKEFPNIPIAFGGCCVDHDRNVTRTWVCKECETSDAAWRAKHPTD